MFDPLSKLLAPIYASRRTPMWVRRTLISIEHAIRYVLFGHALDELDKIPKSEWAAIYCQLNGWEIPASLDAVRPAWWPEPGNGKYSRRAYWFTGLLMDHIETAIGPKACNREWNKDDMTDEQHETFWATRFTKNY